MDDILRKIWQVLKPKPRSALRPPSRISDGSYPVANRWPYDPYERDREMYRRHQEGYFPRGKKSDDEEQVEEGEKEDEKAAKPDWKIRDEQYREDAERERRHEEGYWSKTEESSRNSSSSENSSNDSSTTQGSSEEK